MYMLQSKNSGFVFPHANNCNNQSPLGLEGYGGSMYMFGIEISKNTTDYKVFCEEMKIAENAFIKSIIKGSR